MTNIQQILDTELIFKGDFISGAWAANESEASGTWGLSSPANADWVFPKLHYSIDIIDQVAEASQKALQSWRHLSLEQRSEYVKRFGVELGKRKEFLGKIIALETGKPLDESLGEASLLEKKIDVTIEHGLELVKSSEVIINENQKGEIHWKPKGVMLIIGPFNFPVHLSHGHVVPALLMGNTVILKPSERTPYSAQVYTDAAEAAGFPPGVFQMLQGPGETAKRLMRKSEINGVVATCSYEVGTKIQKTLAESPEKIVALEMGGKNAALIWEQKDVERLADDLIRSSYLTTGQRCTALSRVYVQRQVMTDLVQLFHQKAKELSISHPFDTDPKPYMGPLISADSMEKFLRYNKIAQSEGAEIVMRPKALKGTTRLKKALHSGHYVSPAVHMVEKWNPESAYQNHEIFGPSLFFCPIDSLDEGIEAINSSKYGLVSSVFCPKNEFEYAADRINAGLIYFNRATVGASARLPFGGWGRSGNHRPAGLFAIYACSQVQARMV